MALVALGAAARLAARALCLLLLTTSAAAAETPRSASESEIKAAYLFHFGKFVEWPADALARDAFTVCVLRDEASVGTFREQVARKRIHDKPVDVRVVWHRDEAGGCHMLYVGDAWDPAAASPARGTLLVADGDGATGSALAFVLQGENVRFVADLRAAHQAGLTLSSQLLKLALNVTGAPREDD